MNQQTSNNSSWSDVIMEMDKRFTSANNVPVERATIRRHEWNAILQRLTGSLSPNTTQTIPPVLIARIIIDSITARIPASVTPTTRIEIHPSEWLVVVDEINELRKHFLRACANMMNCACRWKVDPNTGERVEEAGDFVISAICEAHREFFENITKIQPLTAEEPISKT